MSDDSSGERETDADVKTDACVKSDVRVRIPAWGGGAAAVDRTFSGAKKARKSRATGKPRKINHAFNDTPVGKPLRARMSFDELERAKYDAKLQARIEAFVERGGKITRITPRMAQAIYRERDAAERAGAEKPRRLNWKP